MIGAIAGDIIGSVYEGRRSRIKTKDFPLFGPASHFTDDSVLTIAVAQAILEGGDYLTSVRELGRRYPHAGYGGAFRDWLWAEDPTPYNSWGNGAAMRVSPVGWGFDSADEALRGAARTAVMTHSHLEVDSVLTVAVAQAILSRRRPVGVREVSGACPRWAAGRGAP